MSRFVVILVSIFPHLDQNNSEYGHFLRSNSLLRLKENRQILSKIISRNDDERSKINGQTSIKNRKNRSSRPKVFLRNDVLKLCSKFTGERPCRSAISIKLLWNRTSAWVFSCKFAAYFQKHLFLRTPLDGCF